MVEKRDAHHCEPRACRTVVRLWTMPPKGRSRGRGGWQQRERRRGVDPDLTHSLLAYELTCQSLLGVISPHQARLFAELAKKDISNAQRQGPDFVFDDLDNLASLGSNGCYQNHVHKDIVQNLSTPHMQATTIKLPMSLHPDSEPHFYDQDILLPHETFITL